MPALKCESCGKFTTAKNTMAYVPYRFDGALEPADACFICCHCYENCDKDLLYKTSWIKPYNLVKEE